MSLSDLGLQGIELIEVVADYAIVLGQDWFVFRVPGF